MSKTTVCNYPRSDDHSSLIALFPLSLLVWLVSSLVCQNNLWCHQQHDALGEDLITPHSIKGGGVAVIEVIKPLSA
jgi:hypothetical protein